MMKSYMGTGKKLFIKNFLVGGIAVLAAVIL